MPEEVQQQDSSGSNELSWSERVDAELAKKKVDPSYVMVLPEDAVLDEAMPDGYYKKRPCLEEFVAAHYKAEDYDSYFSDTGTAASDEFDWGPGWSDPQWAAKAAAQNLDLPPYFQVRSQVRRVATRAKRAAAPTRHRFKQFLFGNPSLRMVRGRHVKVPSAMVLANLDELIGKEESGLLSVHMPDGRYIDLMALKAGQFAVASAPLPAPLPNPPLDSAANDINGGTPIPEMIDGTYYNDPAAARAVESMLKDKANELHRDETTLEEDKEQAAKDAAKTAPINPPPAPEATEPAAAAEVSEQTEVVDPALERAAADAAEETQTDAAVEEESPKTQPNKGNKHKGGKR